MAAMVRRENFMLTDALSAMLELLEAVSAVGDFVSWTGFW